MREPDSSHPDGWRLVGMIGMIGAPGGAWEIGYWLAPESRGHGIMVRAAKALITVAFNPEGPVKAQALQWRCDIHDGVPNWASWRVAWSLGFRREGHVRAFLANGGVDRKAHV